MGKLTKEREWWLRQFGDGWSVGRPNMLGVKKWEAHTAALVKMSFLEEDGYGMHRITDRARKSLATGDRSK